jgi:hypothetical protein
MTADAKLLACPFCGADPVLQENTVGSWVQCSACNASTETTLTGLGARAAWNRRAYVSSGWIPVSERLPEGDASVFASGIHSTNGSQWREIVSAGFVRRSSHFITHWMPLPTVPSLKCEGETG